MQISGRTGRVNEPTHLVPVFAEVDATICRLAAKDFLTDPVVKGRYSRITSIVSSAYKRHGAIIEKAFVAALKESPHLSVWAEPDFRVSAAAERLADADATASSSTLSYLESAYERVLQVDLLVLEAVIKGSAHMNASAALGTTTQVKSDRCCETSVALRCFSNPMVRAVASMSTGLRLA